MKYAGRRLANSLFLLVAVSLLSFAFAQLAPGDYFSELRNDPRVSPETVAALRAQYGLDRPLPVRYAAWARDAGRPHAQPAAMAKLFATEAAARTCDQAARVLASYGFAMEYPVQRYLRDIRFTLIGGGTSEILKLVIGKELTS